MDKNITYSIGCKALYFEIATYDGLRRLAFNLDIEEVVFSQLTEDNNDVRTEKNTKPSGKKADQNKIINKFEEFLINNIKRDNEGELYYRHLINYHILPKSCAKGKWKQCDIGPSYFLDLQKEKWDDLLIKYEVVNEDKTALEKHVHEFRNYDFKLQVERINTNNSKVYFLNESDEVIFIPKNISCKNITAGDLEKSFTLDDTECFLLSWSDSYDFLYESEKFFSLYNQKQQQEKNQNR
ncbi:7055_t:CDS:2, partial [Funneliformis geosporum]